MDVLMSLSVENADRTSIQFLVREDAGQFFQLRLVEDASTEVEGFV